MISKTVRTTNRLWERLSQKERGSVLFDLGLLDELPPNTVMTSPLIDEFISVSDDLSTDEADRFCKKALSLWDREKSVAKESDRFLRDTNEGFTDRVIVVLGQSRSPMKSRAISSVLSETGAAAKNTRNLINQLKKSGAVQETVTEEGGEPHFSLTAEGKIRRDQLLGLD